MLRKAELARIAIELPAIPPAAAAPRGNGSYEVESHAAWGDRSEHRSARKLQPS
jgi:hypothetical protein